MFAVNDPDWVSNPDIPYGKNRNIDLRRGWIMLVCILTMCTVGSYKVFWGIEGEKAYRKREWAEQ